MLIRRRVNPRNSQKIVVDVTSFEFFEKMWIPFRHLIVSSLLRVQFPVHSQNIYFQIASQRLEIYLTPPQLC